MSWSGNAFNVSVKCPYKPRGYCIKQSNKSTGRCLAHKSLRTEKPSVCVRGVQWLLHSQWIQGIWSSVACVAALLSCTCRPVKIPATCASSDISYKARSVLVEGLPLNVERVRVCPASHCVGSLNAQRVTLIFPQRPRRTNVPYT